MYKHAHGHNLTPPSREQLEREERQRERHEEAEKVMARVQKLAWKEYLDLPPLGRPTWNVFWRGKKAEFDAGVPGPTPRKRRH